MGLVGESTRVPSEENTVSIQLLFNVAISDHHAILLSGLTGEWIADALSQTMGDD